MMMRWWWWFCLCGFKQLIIYFICVIVSWSIDRLISYSVSSFYLWLMVGVYRVEFTKRPRQRLFRQQPSSEVILVWQRNSSRSSSIGHVQRSNTFQHSRCWVQAGSHDQAANCTSWIHTRPQRKPAQGSLTLWFDFFITGVCRRNTNRQVLGLINAFCVLCL